MRHRGDQRVRESQSVRRSGGSRPLSPHEAHDERLAAGAGADLCFAPRVEELYPAGYATWVEVDGPAQDLEGAHRPGHFRGVATICTKLFNIVQPHVAFFGQKDAQQVAVVRRLVRDLNLDIDIR